MASSIGCTLRSIQQPQKHSYNRLPSGGIRLAKHDAVHAPNILIIRRERLAEQVYEHFDQLTQGPAHFSNWLN